MPRYFYLCTAANTPEDQRDDINASWMTFMGKLAATGKLRDGGAFGPEGKTIKPTGSVSNFQWGRSNGTDTGGFWVMEAANIEEAIEYTAGCPQFRAGGDVEVRQILDV